MQPVIKKFLSLQAVLFLCAGLLAGFLIIHFSDLPDRYAPVAIIALAFPFITMMVGDLRRFLLVAVVFFIPIALDINFKHVFENQAGAATLGVSVRDILVVLLLLWWIVDVVAAKNRYFHFFPRITVPALLYLEACVLTLFWAPRSDLAMMEIVQMTKVLLMYFIVANQLRRESDLRVVLWALVGTVLLEGSLALLQLATGRSLALDLFGELQVQTGEFGRLDRVGGTLGHPNRLAMYLEFLLPLCIGLSLIEERHSVKTAARLIFVIGFAAMILTGSRGGWIGVVFSMLIFFYWLVRNRHVSLWTVMKLGVFFVLIFSLLFLVFSDKIENRLFGEDHGSAISRIPMFQMAWSIIKDHPFGGVGINNYAVNMREYNDTLIGRRFTTIARPVHNMYLLITGETGLLGLSMFLWLLLSSILTLKKCFHSRSIFISIFSISLLAGLSAYLVHGLVDKHPPGGNGVFFLFLAIAVALHTRLQEEQAC
jgi:putative inorganic carbon (hco3(-)) transporter